MISCREALEIVLYETSPLAPRLLPFSQVSGLVLAEDVTAADNIPPFDNSSMDGFAVRADDIKGAGPDTPVALKISGEIQAGASPTQELGEGEAIRIMTGAPVPPGSDAVVLKEETETVGDTVMIKQEFPEGKYIRLAGEDVKAGDRVLKKGSVINAATIGFLASLGRSEIQVVPAPTVAVLGTGDELVEVDEPLRPGKIRDSNSHGLVAQVNACGARGVRLEVARDTREETTERIKEALDHNVVITIGGVSVGEYDFVNSVLADLGAEQKFYKLRQEPGKPFAFWLIDGKPIFCLPGNPVSSMISFEQYVRPALLKMMGRKKLFRPLVRAVLAEDFEKDQGKVYFLRVRLDEQNGSCRARPTGPQGSGILTSLVWADGIGVLPEETAKVASGEEIDVQLIHEREDH